ncbi:Clp protease N-terminal domain-containing protein [Streptomyces sp. NPDC090077]|uniref:Clp protease N-terminal domain-containing protein n=1 Tax=Streptomyces sp. NPDC090077 TaxID=3365938 RepID=UPI00381FF776
MSNTGDSYLKHTARFEQVMGSARTIARLHGHQHVSSEHLFLAILLEPADAAAVILDTVADREQVISAMREFLKSPEYMGGIRDIRAANGDHGEPSAEEPNEER